MALQRDTHPFSTVSIVVFILAVAFIWGQSSAQAQGGQEAHDNHVVPQEETYAEIIRPTEVYLVPVGGPNLTGEIPPLDKSKAVPFHAQDGASVQGITLQGFVPGQWYDHYAYYSLDGTEVEQYTNFKETSVGQYIELQGWQNNNGGSNRFVYDGWTGSTYNWLNTWVNNSPTLRPSAEYTQGYGTRLQTYFKTNTSSCPCWLSDYRVGDH